MKTSIKKLISFLLALVLISVNAVSLPVNAETGGSFYLGTYPQSEVTDTELLSVFENLTLSWQSYGYYEGDEAEENHVQSNYMSYADFEYENEKYRAVTFAKYRDCFDTDVDETTYSYQDDNGYEPNTVYYFKFEPIKWNILDTGSGLALAELVLDAQPFSKTSYNDGYSIYYKDAGLKYYANNYAESTIRQWLNSDFYNTVFTEEEKGKIAITTCENVASDEADLKFNSATTHDKVCLLSQSQVEDSSLGFTENADRMALATDYAKVQGAFSTNSKYSGYAYWWTRTPGNYSQGAVRISFLGKVMGSTIVTYTSTGVRPAITFSDGTQKEKEFTVSGKVTSFLSDADKVMLTLENQTSSFTKKVTGNSAEYAFEKVEAGEYTLSVSKENHVTRLYEITVEEDNVIIDLKIHPLGDINGDGKANSVDVASCNSHARGVSTLSGYGLLCADINSDGNVNSVDVAHINAHARDLNLMW